MYLDAKRSGWNTTIFSAKENKGERDKRLGNNEKRIQEGKETQKVNERARCIRPCERAKDHRKEDEKVQRNHKLFGGV